MSILSLVHKHVFSEVAYAAHQKKLCCLPEKMFRTAVQIYRGFNENVLRGSTTSYPTGNKKQAGSGR